MRTKVTLFILAILLIQISCNKSPFQQGEDLYEFYCSSCHMSDGSGLSTIYPALKGNPVVWDKSINLPCLIRTGHKGNALSADMPAYDKMTEVQISNIMNYMNHTINNKKVVSFAWIKEQLEECPLD